MAETPVETRVGGAVASTASAPASDLPRIEAQLSRLLRVEETPQEVRPLPVGEAAAIAVETPARHAIAMETPRQPRAARSTRAAPSIARASGAPSTRNAVEHVTPDHRPETAAHRIVSATASRRAYAAPRRASAAEPAQHPQPLRPSAAVTTRAARPNAPAMSLETSQPRTTRHSARDPGLLAMATPASVPRPRPLHVSAGVGRADRAPTTVVPAARAWHRVVAGVPLPNEGHHEARELARLSIAEQDSAPPVLIQNHLKMDVARETLPPYYLRQPERRGQVIGRMGGSSETEAAVKRALDWFADVQEKDGRWSITRFGGQAGHDAGATGFVVLSFLGWGATHAGEGPYADAVAAALEWLTKKMKPDGDLRDDDAENAMYSHGIATLALTEAYAMTRDQRLRKTAQRAIDFIISAQNPDDGSWRYHPGESGDTSVLGWQLMALSSARLAGLRVPEESLRRAESWLHRVGGGEHGGLYGYRNKVPLATLVAEGMFCRQLIGTERGDPRMGESAMYLHDTPLDLESKTIPVYYYAYYGTLALYQHQGPAWESWNRGMKPALLESQVKLGANKGSWDPRGLYANRTGRLVATAMATLSLEVYYRYLPLYAFNPGLSGDD